MVPYNYMHLIKWSFNFDSTDRNAQILWYLSILQKKNDEENIWMH